MLLALLLLHLLMLLPQNVVTPLILPLLLVLRALLLLPLTPLLLLRLGPLQEPPAQHCVCRLA